MYSSLLGNDARSSSSKDQDYQQIVRDCRASRKLFEDPLFSPKADSPVKWLRPNQISPAPKFIADGVSRFDVKQGELGDCWLVAAMANLTLNEKLFARVVPLDQTFEPSHYCGAFRFCFWRFGKHVEVVIDDRLPVDYYNNQPKYVHSSDRNEFWSPLLEKAYAKLYTSFEALEGGDFCEAMVDFTGGLAEGFLVNKPTIPKSIDLWKVLKKSYDSGSMLGCSIRRPHREDPFGLVDCHAYGITRVDEFHLENVEDGPAVPMLRLRNPWGQKEFTGAWSDRSARWYDLSQSERDRIGFTVKDDGEFWITFDDWRRNFTHLEICHLSPESLDSATKHRWFPNQLEGSWCLFKSAGGHLTWNNAKEFSTNPQYMCQLTDPDRDDPSGNCTLVVSLMQRDHRLADTGHNGLTIGFYVYAVSAQNLATKLGENFFANNQPIVHEPQFTGDREVTSRFHLPPGQYLIVPTTQDSSEEGQFLLRTWTEHQVECFELTESCSDIVYSTPAAIRCDQPIPCMSLPSYNNNNHQHSDDDDDDDEQAHDDDIRYPSLTYLGKPKIVNRPICAASKRRTMINIETDQATVVTIHEEKAWFHDIIVNNIVLHNNNDNYSSPQQKQPKQQRGLFRKIVRRILKVKSMYQNQSTHQIKFQEQQQ